MTRKTVKMIIAVVIPLFICSTVSAKNFKVPPEILAKFSKLQVLVMNNSGDAIGQPFTPLIAKPKPCQRIAIVGAGLAGLHMSYLLKKKGFTNVVVLEKESRIGGKVMTKWIAGIPHEMGAVYTGAHYRTSLYPLAKELGVDDFVPRPKNVGVWLDNLPVPLPYSQYIIDTIQKFTKASNTLEAIEELLDAAFRYTVIHQRLFGNYEGELMNKPDFQVLSHLNQSFMSYLTEHDLLALAPILIATHTIQGYDHLDEVSALYGLLWNTPEFLQSMIALGLGMGVKSNNDMFRYGFQQLTDKLAAFANIRLNVKIENIRRDPSGITITYKDDQIQTITEKFDFLIWAADAREGLQVLSYPTPTEKEFSNLQNTWFTTTLFESKERCLSLPPIEYWMGNIVHKRDHSVWARRHSKSAINGEEWLEKRGLFAGLQVYVAYQKSSAINLWGPWGVPFPRHYYSDYMSGVSAIDAAFTKQFHNGQCQYDVKVIDRKIWNYFPRFSTDKLAEGVLWKILENQGDMHTWFIGSSVIFESARSVIEYNQLMMRRMEDRCACCSHT